ncbi:hypothetical protein BgiBS90_033182, partial [Biomphalaria glabrata]
MFRCLRMAIKVFCQNIQMPQNGNKSLLSKCSEWKVKIFESFRKEMKALRENVQVPKK